MSKPAFLRSFAKLSYSASSKGYPALRAAG